MVGQFPSFRQSRFPNDLPPTLLHPASPKIRPAVPAKEVKEADASSIATTSTFSSTVDLLKSSVKKHFPTSSKEYRLRKDSKHKTANEKESSTALTDSKTPKQRDAEAYMVQAAMK